MYVLDVQLEIVLPLAQVAAIRATELRLNSTLKLQVTRESRAARVESAALVTAVARVPDKSNIPTETCNDKIITII